MQLIILGHSQNFTDTIWIYLGHNQNFTDTIWIVGPLGQAISKLKKKAHCALRQTQLWTQHNVEQNAGRHERRQTKRH